MSPSRRELHRVRPRSPVGEYVRDHVPRSEYTRVETRGHSPRMRDPEETTHAITRFLGPIDSFLRRTRG